MLYLEIIYEKLILKKNIFRDVLQKQIENFLNEIDEINLNNMKIVEFWRERIENYSLLYKTDPKIKILYLIFAKNSWVLLKFLKI